MLNILLVEDDEALSSAIREKLLDEGFSVSCAFDGKQAAEALDEAHFDLIISDVMMPKMDGFELSRYVRRDGKSQPILIITAKSEIEDMQTGFKSGADDYMSKPINLKELVLRVHALLRRAKIANEKRLLIGGSELDYDTLSVRAAGERISLAPKEFRLLFLLLSYAGRIFTRFEIMSEIWGYETDSDERVVDTHIKKLLAKFENSKDFEIITVRGLGYKAVKKERA
ncbi:response regulator transcription factor [uncultured Campylobacter sp.]|uniref:response regulator transcription factor n=1 Tax=uncultured Campylobacter sp. TaxID=218934 RepID=UPI00261873D7|nr:response regulator transcription factor [uncultured Campylobacter sp.]